VTPLEFASVVFALSVAAGFLGSLLGVGGGLVVVPALTLLLDVDIRYSIGATIISVIATSIGAAFGDAQKRRVNMRLAMFLCIASTAGALTGAYLTGVVVARWLYVLFGVVMGASALAMLRKRDPSLAADVPADRFADRLRLHGTYMDEAVGEEVSYRVTGTRLGFVLMYVAGILSGVLGIGSGVLKVPTMDLAMRLPIKVSTGTSNLMIGITATATAGVYFARGQINPLVAGPVAAGVLVGARAGSRLLGRLHSSVVRWVFVLVLLWVSSQMLLRGLR
jgi:uncharacterized membrane protein YfcA